MGSPATRAAHVVGELKQIPLVDPAPLPEPRKRHRPISDDPSDELRDHPITGVHITSALSLDQIQRDVTHPLLARALLPTAHVSAFGIAVTDVGLRHR